MATNGLRRRRNINYDILNVTTARPADEYATQHDLFGPISGALLVDPVRIQVDIEQGEQKGKDKGKGNVAYERKHITKWLNKDGTSPMTRKPATVADLVTAHDKQEEIRELVTRYPDAQIVKDWLKEQPAWYTQAIQRIRAPVVQAMSRAMEHLNQEPSVDACLRCCEVEGGSRSGARVGAGIGACAGCACAMSLGSAALPHLTQPGVLPATAALLPSLPVTGAVGGGLVGAFLGPQRCVECATGLTGAALTAAARSQGLVGGKRKRKTKKSKRKKKRKTRKSKHKHKKTIKKKRKRKRKGTKRRKKH